MEKYSIVYFLVLISSCLFLWNSFSLLSMRNINLYLISLMIKCFKLYFKRINFSNFATNSEAFVIGFIEFIFIINCLIHKNLNFIQFFNFFEILFFVVETELLILNLLNHNVISQKSKSYANELVISFLSKFKQILYL